MIVIPCQIRVKCRERRTRVEEFRRNLHRDDRFSILVANDAQVWKAMCTGGQRCDVFQVHLSAIAERSYRLKIWRRVHQQLEVLACDGIVDFKQAQMFQRITTCCRERHIENACQWFCQTQ